MNKKIIGALFVLLFTAGCSLYKDNRSPVYASLADKKVNKVSTKLSKNTVKAPWILNDKSSNASIEAPSRKTIEIKSSNNDPYVNVASNQKHKLKVVRPDRVKARNSRNFDDDTSRLKGYPLVKDSQKDKSNELKGRAKKETKERHIHSNNKKDEDRVSRTQKTNNNRKKEQLSANNRSTKSTNEKKTIKKEINTKRSSESKEEKTTTVTKTVSRAKPKKKTAVQSLLKEAHNAVKQGNLDGASAALERAHRIEPSNAKILYDIAQIKYALGKYRESDSFASRATNFSKSRSLSKKIWQLLYNARKSQGNKSGAELAKQKVDSF